MTAQETHTPREVEAMARAGDVGVCAYCKVRDRLTLDHILPKRTGARKVLPCGARNIRLVCSMCNSLREHAKDCQAVALMATGVAREVGIKPRRVLMAWGYIGGTMQRADAVARLSSHRAMLASSPYATPPAADGDGA